MVSASFKSGLHFASAAIGTVAAIISTQAAAINMTLPTTNIQANAQYTFTSDTQDLMQSMGINVRAMGNSVQTTPGLWSFSMPVTDVSLSISLLPMSITPTAGHASGSALSIYSGKGELQLGNFALDFSRNVLSADLTTAAGTTKNFDVYNFNVAQGLHVSTSGGLSLDMSLIDMRLTSTAQSTFGKTLGLSRFATSMLSEVDFGLLDIHIAPALRFNASDKAFTGSVVPEPASHALFTLGLLGLTAQIRRKVRQSD